MEKFRLDTEIVSGSGAVSFLRELKPQKVFLVTDPYFLKSGLAQQMVRQTEAEHWEIFGEVTPDPTVELAAKGAARFQAFDPDLLVALGGGSSMDCAKAISCFAKKKIRFAAIPTTSGSGSEVTDFAILTHGSVKHPLVEESLRPDYAILDSDLLESLPKSLIADAGYDVLTHAAEAFAARKAGVLSDLYAGAAFRKCYENLLKSYEGNKNVRGEVHLAATMAGVAFTQAGLGLCHAMAHSLGGMFHVPHGRLNAILLPSVIRHNLPGAAHRYAELSRAAGIPGAADTVAVRNLLNGLIRLRKQLNLPENLVQAGVKTTEVGENREKIVQAAVKDPCCETNPVPVTENLVREILKEVTGRG